MNSLTITQLLELHDRFDCSVWKNNINAIIRKNNQITNNIVEIEEHYIQKLRDEQKNAFNIIYVLEKEYNIKIYPELSSLSNLNDLFYQTLNNSTLKLGEDNQFNFIDTNNNLIVRFDNLGTITIGYILFKTIKDKFNELNWNQIEYLVTKIMKDRFNQEIKEIIFNKE